MSKSRDRSRRHRRRTRAHDALPGLGMTLLPWQNKVLDQLMRGDRDPRPIAHLMPGKQDR